MPEAERLSFEFEVGEGRPRLDHFVAAQLPKVSLTRIRSLITDGEVLVNGNRATKGFKPQKGDKITVGMFSADKSAATPENIPLEILFEDEHLIVVNKPVGLLTHPSHREKSGTLTNALAFHFWETSREPIRPGLVHRLDRNTSGVIVIAKTLKAHRTLSKHFRERKVRKLYLAIVSGVVEKNAGEIDAPIGCDPAQWPHWRVMDDGRNALTKYLVKRRFREHTLLELEPLTGRTHQLRIHCNLIAHPILGDPFYASKTDPHSAELKLKHHQLHAERLIFNHPATGKVLDLKAPMPESMLALIERVNHIQ
jgi:23S rRNA pseudouridine1911/1915/1917 synthase